jgi:hypothetical protein
MVAPGFPRVMTMGLVALIAAYGQYAFFKHNIASYLVRKVEFVNYPLGVSFWRFELEYLAMMVLFALVARNLGKLLGSPKNSSR